MDAVILLILLALVLALVLMFNRMVRLRNNTRTAFSQIDVMLKRRADLVPTLVQTVSGYAKHEQQTLEQVTAARSAAEAAQGLPDQVGAENALTGALARLMAVAEQYPDLKANENFKELQASLVETEDKIALARHVYNDTVQTYENAREQVPTNAVAALFNFREVKFFELELVSERNTPEVTT